jgi:hypothetical protein
MRARLATTCAMRRFISDDCANCEFWLRNSCIEVLELSKRKAHPEAAARQSTIVTASHAVIMDFGCVMCWHMACERSGEPSYRGVSIVITQSADISTKPRRHVQ